MSTAELMSLLPLVILAAGILIVLLASAFVKARWLSFALSAVTLVAAFVALFVPGMPRSNPLLEMDNTANFYMGLIFLSALGVALLSNDYLRSQGEQKLNEYFLVLLLATLGSAVLVASSHFASLFLGLEILSVSLYVLIAYPREDSRAIEAGTKYLVLAGTSSAFLLFGMALVYADTGTMRFADLGSALGNASDISLLGLVMLVVGIGFKLSLAPFHMWSPDVYQGAPAPVTGFIATISKGAMVALLMRLFLRGDWGSHPQLRFVLALLAVASMFVGNLTALRQMSIKRLLAYSSVAHLGYLLVGILAGPNLGASAVTFYLVTYFVTTLIAFGVVSVLSRPEHEADAFSDYHALFWTRPGLALALSAALLSLAGMPLTAGFTGKFYLVVAGAGNALWILLFILILNSALGLYYYLRFIVVMFAPAQVLPARASGQTLAVAVPSGTTLALLSVVLVWLGVFPAPLLRLIHDAITLR